MYSKNLKSFKNSKGLYELEPPLDKKLRDDGIQYPTKLTFVWGKKLSSDYDEIVYLTARLNDGAIDTDYVLETAGYDLDSVIEALVGSHVLIENVLEEPLIVPTNRGALELTSRTDLYDHYE